MMLLQFLDRLSNFEAIGLALVGVCGLYQTYFHFFYFLKVYRRIRPYDRAQTTDCPGVSVIICAKNESHNLENYLQAILTQEYPQFEVILVDEGSTDNSMQVLNYYKTQYENLVLTHIPQTAKVKSTKKLGITLAVRAAQYDYVLLTDAEACPSSNLWIKSMMQAFQNNHRQVDIVLGFSPYFIEKSTLNSLLRYDALISDSHVLGAAINHTAYAGNGRNIAYRKAFFEQNGGFQALMNANFAEEDLFVNRFAKKDNTAVVLTPESMIWGVPPTSFTEWKLLKQRKIRAILEYSLVSILHITRESILRMGLYGASITLFFAASPDVKIVAMVVLGIFLMMHYVIISLLSRKIYHQNLGIIALIGNMLLPIVNLFIIKRSKKNKI